MKLVPELAADKNLVVTRSDKGNDVKNLDKKAYISGREGIVSDTDKFSVVNESEENSLPL